jgi:hypothetical protein
MEEKMKSLEMKGKSVKSLMVIFLVIFVTFSGNMFGQEKGSELSVTSYGFVGDYFSIFPGAMLSLGLNSPNGLGAEFGGFVGVSGSLILTGNFMVSPIRTYPVKPYLFTGIGVIGSIHGFGAFFADVGAGTKLYLSDKFALRAEYQRWFIGDFSEINIGLVRAGVSNHF